MADFNRKKTNSFWHSPLMLIVLFVILILFGYNMIGLIEKERETAKKKDLILSNIETLRSRESSLSSDIERLKTEEGIEETIRDKYQVVKQDEKMVTIIDQQEEVVVVETKESKHGFVNWIKNLFDK